MTESNEIYINTVRNLIKPPTDIKKIDKAISICLKILNKNNKNTLALFEISLCFSKKKLYSEAIKYLLILIDINPQQIPARYLISECYSKTGNWSESVKHAKFAIQRDSVDGKIELGLQNVEAISTLGTSALFDKKWKEAQNTFIGIIKFFQKIINQKTTPIKPFNLERLPKISERKVYPILYLPIEVKAREFESKALLAITAAERGFNVVFGRTWVLSMGQFSDLPPGVILFKTLNAIDANNMAIAIGNGKHIIAALDEEAFGRSVSKRALNLNVEPLAINVTDLILVQGEKHLNSWVKNLNIADSKIQLTGNPKIDLLNDEDLYLSNNKRKNILFCTMSGNVNPKGRSFSKTIQQTLISGSVSPSKEMVEELSKLMFDIAEFEVKMIPQFKSVIEGVAKHYKDYDIIVRPHPIENEKLWHEILDASIQNIKIDNKGPLTDSLRNSDIMIHVTGCGSGVEAALKGIKAIRFEGEGLVDPDVGLSSSLNYPAKNLKDIINIIDKKISSKSIKKSSNLNYYIKRNKNKLISSEVADALFKFYEKNSRNEQLDISKLEKLKDRRKKSFDLKDFHLQKFPHTSNKDVDSLLEDLSIKFNLSKPSKIISIEDGLFLLKPNKG